MEQRSEEWFAARLGVITASRFKDVMAKTKSGSAATREAYKWQIVAERLSGEQQDVYQNSAMRWGTEKEPEAMAAYEWLYDVEVDQVGLIKLSDTVGCSPDGFVTDNVGIEIKCPYNTSIHLQTLDSGEMPKGHKAQVQGCMWVTGREFWDFVSFDPRLPEKIQLFCKRIERDDDYIKELKKEIDTFDDECNELIERLLR
jgi:putative phage-type endonuclease